MRVIAGVARGRQLRAADATRPTADVIKGAMFSMLEALAYKRGFEPDEDGNLAAALAWPRALDLFAGAGGLGIEALSRGAVWAEFVDSSPEAARVIASNLRSTGLDGRARVHQSTVQGALDRVQGPIDVVFLDPPYAAVEVLSGTLHSIDASGLLRSTSVIVVEQEATAEPPETVGALRLSKTRRHGRTRVSLYVVDSA